MWRALCIAALAIACRDPAPAREKPAPAVARPAVAPPAKDPWAVETTSESVADLACPTVTAPYFYRIEKDGKTSHLLGTRHISVPLRKMPASVRDALRAAKLVVIETIDDAPPVAADVEIPAVLGPELWQRYKAVTGDAIAASVEHATPTRALVMLIVRFEDRLASLETDITAEATAHDQPMRGLETSAFQQALLARWLDERALRGSVKNLDGVDELREDTIEDLREYCSGTDDSPGLNEKERADMLAAGYTPDELARYEKELLVDRNARWIPVLEQMFADGDVFVAVGADHLRGDHGVPALLSAKGYTVVRVTPPVK